MNKDCKQCGGSGAVIEYGQSVMESDEPKLCPCVTEKLRKLTDALEQYRGTGIQVILDGEPVTDDEGFPVYVDYATAALEDT